VSERGPGTSGVDATLTAPFTRLDPDHVVTILREGWGITASSLRRLSTERDDSFVAVHPEGRVVAKVAHPLDLPEVLDLQCHALVHATDRDPGLPLPRVLPDVDGAFVRPVVGARGETRQARVLSFLPGSPLDYDATTADQRRAIGGAAGRLSLALADFEHAASRRVLAWDLQQVSGLRPLVELLDDPVVRSVVELQLDDYDSYIGAALKESRQQVVHHDLNADNLLVDAHTPGFVTGILDFGDVVHSSVVGDLAVTMAYAVGAGGALERHHVDPWLAPYDVAAGFTEVRALNEDEAWLLPALVRTRLAQKLLVNSWLASSNPDNAGYTGRSIERSGRALRRLAEAPSPLEREGS
jgi:hydroxylysine kinase